MKKQIISFSLSLLFAATASAQTIIVDELSTEGDFTEDPSDSLVDGGSLSNWAVGGGRNPIVGNSSNQLGRPSGFSDRYYQAERRRTLALDTGYDTAATGESYNLSLYTLGTNSKLTAEDFLEFTVYYTDDNTLGGTRQDEETFQFFPNLVSSDFTQQTATVTFGTDPGAGKTLFFFMKTADTTPNNATNDAFIGVDNVNFSVVPEPSSFALLAGMFGLTWVMLRRR